MGFLSSPLFLGIVAVVVLVYGLPVAIGYWKLSRLTFLCGPLKWQPADTVPEYAYEYFADAIASLESHQFQRIGYYTIEAVQGHVEWAVLLQGRNQTRALVSTKEQTQQQNSVTVLLSNLFTNQGTLETINQTAPGTFFPPQQRLWEQYVGPVSVDELLQIHQQKLNELSTSETIPTLTTEQYLEQGKAYSIQRAEYFRQLGEIYWVQPQVAYRWRWRKVVAIIVGHFRKTWFAKQPAPSAKAADTTDSISSNSRVERELTEFQRQQQRESRMSRRTRSWLFLGTLAFFITVYASVFDLQGLLIFVAVLLLHEGGHVLAMKLFGYRDATMLFIPFLGGLATARKEDATLTEKVWISLAGPLPGLCLGIGLAIALTLGWIAPVSWGQDAITILVILNLFNLLPVYPLDGGQVADLLLFSRNPHLGIAFKTMGIGLLILAGLLLGAPLLFAFAILMSFSIPSSFRLAKLNNQLRTEFRTTPEASLATEDPDTLTRRILQRLLQPPYDKLTFPQKSTLLTEILHSRKKEAAPWTTRVGLSSVYLVSLLVGMIGGIGAVFSTPIILDATETELAQETELATPIASATTPHFCKTNGTLQTASTGKDAVMRDRQLTLIGTFETSEHAQATWQTLQPQLGPDDSVSLFGQTLFVSTSNTQTQDRVSSAFNAAGARVHTEDLFADSGTVLRFTAEAVDDEQATQVAEELSDFFTLRDRLYEYSLSAPWEEDPAHLMPEVQLQQANARYTYAQLLHAEEDAYLQQTGPRFFWLQTIVAYLIGNDQWAHSASNAWTTEHYQMQKEAAQQLLHSSDEQIDKETIHLFLGKIDLEIQQIQVGYTEILELDESEDAEAAIEAYEQRLESLDQRVVEVQDQIAARLGATSNPSDNDTHEDALADYWMYGDVARSSATVSIEDLVSYQTQETLPAIAAYFCEQGFTNIRYSLESDAELWAEDQEY
ncbi:MAG: site-2 protease family protein [Cyanobacteria bacterium J06559_3]